MGGDGLMHYSRNRFLCGNVGSYNRDNLAGILTPNRIIHSMETELTSGWSRNDDWLRLPTINEGEQKFCGLVGVFQGQTGYTGSTGDAQYVAFTMSGNFIVDWGNGITQSFTAATRAQYAYRYDELPASTTTEYEGMRQVIIQAYPQAGATFTDISFQVNPVTADGITLNTTFGVGYNPGWLEIKLSAPYLTSYLFGRNNNANMIYPNSLAQIEFVGETSLTSIGQSLGFCHGIRRLVGQKWTKKATSATNLLRFGGGALNYVDAFDLGICTSFASLFDQSGLLVAPFMDTRSATDFQSLFGTAPIFVMVPLNSSNVTKMNNLFYGAYCRYLPKMDTSKVTTFFDGFYVYSLLRFPDWDTSKATFHWTLGNCRSLKDLGNINTSASPQFGRFLRYNRKLWDLDQINTDSLTSASAEFFPNAYDRFIPKTLNTSKLTDFTGLFGSQYSVPFIPLLSGASGTVYTDAFSSCYSLRWGTITGTKASINYANCCLSPTALDDIFNNLASGVSGPSITITNNWGLAGCSTGIATSKGWAVIT